MEAIKEHTYQIGEVARKYHLSVARPPCVTTTRRA